MKKWTLADWEALYPEKLECMRAHVAQENKAFFTPGQMQKLHKIGYNHAMHIIDHGVSSGVIADPNGSHRFQFT